VTSTGWDTLQGDGSSSPSTDLQSANQLRSVPGWLREISDEVLRGLLEETYRAINNGLLALPLMGARTAFDRAMDLKLGEDRGTFEEKLKAMKLANHADDREIRILKLMIDAGHAASHRAWLPTLDVLSRVMTELERKIWDWFFRDAAAEEVRKNTPARQKSARRAK
jgi:hypothetical protein